MAKCNYCSAPLPANTNVCSYCNARNDVDLKGKLDYAVIRGQSERQCPHCQKPLQTVDINLNGSFLIDRCVDCFGLFFDPGQVEALLDSVVANVFEVNLQHLDTINKDRFQGSNAVKYIKCPVCQQFMSRHVFGYRSGVIIDQCKGHGIWLDSGEVTHLLEWKKAGGQLLQDKRKPTGHGDMVDRLASPVKGYGFSRDEANVLNALADLLGKLSR